MKKITTICFVVAFAFAWTQAAVATENRTASSGILYTRFYPAAIFPDGKDATTLEVVTDGMNIQEVQVYWHWYDPDWQSLYDDGTHGDRIPGDGVYTLNDLKATFANFYAFFGNHIRDFGVDIKVTTTGGEDKTSWVQLGLADPEMSYPAANLAGNCYATTCAFFIVDQAGEIFAGYPVTSIDCGRQLFPVAYKKLYERFADVFDFIIVMPATRLVEPDDYVERVPYCITVRNDVQHIGVPLFDESSKCYSKGHLRSVIYHSYGFGAILEHELGHTWGMRLGSTLGLIKEDQNVEGLYGHWLAQSDVDGQMSSFIAGCTLSDNGNGTWRLKDQNRDYMPYSPLELYAMGLVPPEQVPPAHILYGLDTSNPEMVTADSTKTITIQQIMAAHGGERIPTSATSQKDFRVAFIFVSDREFSAGEFAYFSGLAEYFASDRPGSWYMMPFEAATGGRATLDASLPGMEYLAVATPGDETVVSGFDLTQNYPNPFNANTRITFFLDRAAEVSISVFDALGREVLSRSNQRYAAGQHALLLEATDWPSGLYLCRLRKGAQSQTIKMLMIR